jgi:hypothetical protein
VFTGSGYLDSASAFDAEIAFCSLVTGRVSDPRLIQVIRRPASGTLGPVTVSGGTTIRGAAPAMPVWAVPREITFQ